MVAETDIAVVGAGAAGLAAGEALRQAGADYQVLEASDRLGGRAWTDRESFPGMSLDRGCHWLHSASINPLRAAADRLGFAYDRGFSFGKRALFAGRRRLTDDQVQQVDTALEDAFEALADSLVEDRHGGGQDVAVSEMVDQSGPWYPLFENIFSLMTSGTPATVSALDFARARDTFEDYPVADGLGALVLANARQVTVQTRSAVRLVDWRGRSVALETDQGRLKAKAVIITVSTGVLGVKAIRFTPALPSAIQSAIAACPLGHYEKVVLHLREPLAAALMGLPPCLTAFTRDRAGRIGNPVSYLIRPFGRPLVVAEIAGPVLQDLMREGPAALVEHAVTGLEGALGLKLRRQIEASLVTDWRGDPLIRGAYSFAQPGRAHERQRLAAPIGGRIFLAGEAVSLEHFASCHGAHMSGIAAAKKALAAIKG